MLKMQVIGNLGKDCLVNNVSGKSVINFTVAHTEKYKDSQGNLQERTTWVECAWWTDRTTVAQYLTKGKQVYVEGNPEVRSFTRNDGTHGASLSLRVRELQLLGNRNEGSSNTPSGNAYQQAPSTPPSSSTTITEGDADDLPF
ncbi:MAG: single-stranded DNA-binding protein [Chitinophagaceae bacterium]|nr:MAG: single-stranded DNA-binding protein [Chitinophagaceae bacterium]